MFIYDLSIYDLRFICIFAVDMLKLVLIIIAVLAVCMLLLTVNIWLRGGEFRSQHTGQSKEMRRRGIHCVQSMDAMERKEHKELLTKVIKNNIQ